MILLISLVILMDDSIANGATIFAAIKMCRQKGRCEDVGRNSLIQRKGKRDPGSNLWSRHPEIAPLFFCRNAGM